jgi:hypothetical protein
MDSHRLPAFPLASFPQSIVEQEIMRVNRILARVYAQNQPEVCCYESEERHPGSCDGGSQCQKRATVHDLKTGLEFCTDHFKGVIFD